MRSAMLLVAVAACGGGVSRPDAIVVIDARILPDQDLCDFESCNLVDQVGCNPGESCTWVRVEVGTAAWGRPGCVPSGSVQAGASCTWGPHGEATGYDDCARGLVCDAPREIDRAIGTCLAICDSTAAPGTRGACETGFVCHVRTGLFANVGCPATVTGVCDPM